MKSIGSSTKLRDEEVRMISGIENIRKLTAKDAMTKAAFVYQEDDVCKITKKLKSEDTSVCVVVTKDKRFVGEISNEDLIRLFLHQIKSEPLTRILNIGYCRKFLYMKAKELVNKHQSTVFLGTPINKAIELIYQEGFQYIPVLDKNKKVVGVLTPSSILRLLKNH